MSPVRQALPSVANELVFLVSLGPTRQPTVRLRSQLFPDSTRPVFIILASLSLIAHTHLRKHGVVSYRTGINPISRGLSRTRDKFMAVPRALPRSGRRAPLLLLSRRKIIRRKNRRNSWMCVGSPLPLRHKYLLFSFLLAVARPGSYN